jgi:alkylation response protein AidB-like acyl-CoA dehydrogenase
LDFFWSEEQLALRKSIISFAKEELNKNLIEQDREEAFDREGWKMSAEMGIHGLPVPPEYGGQGTDILTTACAVEALGYGCRDNGHLIYSINAHIWSAEIPFLMFCTDAQKRR